LPKSIKSTVTIKSKDAFGSGFIISNDGYIITNYHVVSEPENLRVRLNNEKEYDADIIRVSKIYDLALIKIEANDLIPFSINNSKEIEVATEIYAVGTPTAEDLSQTISKGIISGIRKSGDSKLIQTDASVNSGNSGGPIIDKNGVVLGVVSSKLKGFGVEGVAFGIPAYEVLDRLKLNLK
jgi:S1-C subfamily serine protease